MPLIENSSYTKRPYYLFNRHLETIIPSIFRKIEGVQYIRERLELPDGDFLDIDWSKAKTTTDRLVIVTHGLEGNSDRHYVKGTVKLMNENGWDALAWNCRSCSGEMNRNLRMYHHGDIEDIQAVIEHALLQQQYESIHLIGFSMGGNITLKYLGVNGTKVPSKVKGGVAISAPCDLTSGAALLDQPQSYFYKKKFYTRLSNKMRLKAAQYPEEIDIDRLSEVKCWRDFDELFSAPINGFENAQDFYDQASAVNYLEGIQRPILLINALNDPILTPECYPKKIASTHPYLYLETPKKGGHVSFMLKGEEYAWMDLRTLEFLKGL